jgi:hypothetical protein
MDTPLPIRVFGVLSDDAGHKRIGHELQKTGCCADLFFMWAPQGLKPGRNAVSESPWATGGC